MAARLPATLEAMARCVNVQIAFRTNQSMAVLGGVDQIDTALLLAASDETGIASLDYFVRKLWMLDVRVDWPQPCRDQPVRPLQRVGRRNLSLRRSVSGRLYW